MSISGVVTVSVSSAAVVVAVTSFASAVEACVAVGSVAVSDVSSTRSRGGGRSFLFDSGVADLRTTTVGSGEVAVAVPREASGAFNGFLFDTRVTDSRSTVGVREGTIPVIGGNRNVVCVSKMGISTIGVDAVDVGAECVVGGEGSAEASAVEGNVTTGSDRSGRSARSNSVSASKSSIPAVSGGAGISGTESVSTGTESIAKSKTAGRASRSSGSSRSTV